MSKNKIEKALNPDKIVIEHLTVNHLLNLKNEEALILYNSHIPCTITIRKDYRIEEMLNIPVVFYSDSFLIKDNLTKYFQEHDVKLSNEELILYIDELLSCKTPQLFGYLKNLKRKGLKMGDKIVFTDGRTGQILIPDESLIHSVNIMYVPFKKDGTLSKVKPRYIYANDEFNIVTTD